MFSFEINFLLRVGVSSTRLKHSTGFWKTGTLCHNYVRDGEVLRDGDGEATADCEGSLLRVSRLFGGDTVSAPQSKH